MSTRVLGSPVARSLTLHFFLLMVAFFFATHAPKPSLFSDPIEVSVNDYRDQSHRAIVQKSAGEESKTAKKDAYLSDKTRVVKEEQSSKNIGELRTKAGSEGRAASDAPHRITLSDLGLKIETKPQAQPFDDQRNWAKPQTGEALKGGQYIQGMKEGEFSALNTKEFVFYSYFERVRQQLDQAWQPILRDNVKKIFKAGRQLASNSDFVTRTLVTMNSKGEILRIQVLEESGTSDLDRAAIEALNQAGPYPNPPKGLIDPSGLVQIRWDFILKT